MLKKPCEPKATANSPVGSPWPNAAPRLCWGPACPVGCPTAAPRCSTESGGCWLCTPPPHPFPWGGRTPRQLGAALSRHGTFGTLLGSGRLRSLRAPRRTRLPAIPATSPSLPADLGTGSAHVAHTCYGLSSSAVPTGRAPAEHPGSQLWSQAASPLTLPARSHGRAVLLPSSLKEQGQEQRREGQRGARGAPHTPPAGTEERQSPWPPALPPGQERTGAANSFLWVYSLRAPSLWILQGPVGLSSSSPSCLLCHCASPRMPKPLQVPALQRGTRRFQVSPGWREVQHSRVASEPTACCSPTPPRAGATALLGVRKATGAPEPSSCSSALRRGSARADEPERPLSRGSAEDTWCLPRRSHGRPSPAPSPSPPPQSGEGLGKRVAPRRPGGIQGLAPSWV